MAKKKFKPREVDAQQFLETNPPVQWPPRVQVNALSYTGYSYGTLGMFENEPGAPLTRDGFEISSTEWVVINGQGLVTKLSDVRMQAEYED